MRERTKNALKVSLAVSAIYGVIGFGALANRRWQDEQIANFRKTLPQVIQDYDFNRNGTLSTNELSRLLEHYDVQPKNRTNYSELK